MRNRLAVVAAAASMLASFAIPESASAVSAWVTPESTVVTGKFTLTEKPTDKIRTIKAVARRRTVVSAPLNTDIYSLIALNPEEWTLTLHICNQNGCDNSVNHLCVAPLVFNAVSREELELSSTTNGCRLNVTVDVGNAQLPRFFPDKVESTSTASFRAGASVQGWSSTGAQGVVVRHWGWGVGLPEA